MTLRAPERRLFDIDSQGLTDESAPSIRLEMESLDALARIHGDDLNVDLTAPLVTFIEKLHAITEIEGLALVNRNTRHLSIYVLMDIISNDSSHLAAVRAITENYHQFSRDLVGLTDRVRSGVLFYNTRDEVIQSVATRIRDKCSRDPSVSIVSFLTKE